jgi:AcrR family transcriptional regulator
MPISDKPADEAETRTPRQRLSPDTRIQLILDAALVEFSTHGYNATRIDDIAARAGLSKGGLYAHFSGKDKVFEALLKRSLVAPVLEIESLLDHSADMRSLIEHLVDLLHAQLTNPVMRATARLLFSEGHRLPDVVALWRQNTLDAMHFQLGVLLRRCVAQGLCKDSAVVRHPWLILLPVAHTLIQQLAFGTQPPKELRQARDAHVDMLCDLLLMT